MDEKLFRLFLEVDNQKEHREHYVRAPFGYPGGKSKLVTKILPYLPYKTSYIEPFGGSGVILLAREESPLEVFNDRYAGVVSFYRCLRDEQKCQQLIDRLELTLHAREEFLWAKTTWKDVEDDVERAARWYYMVQTSFGSLGKAFGRATSGKANMGKKLKNNLKLFWAIHNRLKYAQIENLDWRDCIFDYDSYDTVFYLDPPYILGEKYIYEYNFTKDDHIELLTTIKDIKGFVALSGYDNELYDQYSWDNKVSWPIKRTVENLHGRTSVDTILDTLWIKEAK